MSIKGAKNSDITSNVSKFPYKGKIDKKLHQPFVSERVKEMEKLPTRFSSTVDLEAVGVWSRICSIFVTSLQLHYKESSIKV